MTAELDAIASRAEQREGVTIDNETGKPIGDAPPAGDPGAQPVPDPRVVALAGDIVTLLTLIRDVVAKSNAYPATIALYPDEVIAAIGGTAAPVIVKHGWLRGFSIVDKYKEEIGLAMVVLPMALATAGAVQKDIEAQKARRAAAKQAADNQGGSPAADPV